MKKYAKRKKNLNAKVTVACYQQEKEKFEDIMEMLGNKSSPYLRKLMRETIAAYDKRK